MLPKIIFTYVRNCLGSENEFLRSIQPKRLVEIEVEFINSYTACSTKWAFENLGRRLQ